MDRRVDVRADDDHRDRPGDRAGAQAGEDLFATDVRQFEVEQDQVRL
jgi:hypothetical protein